MARKPNRRSTPPWAVLALQTEQSTACIAIAACRRIVHSSLNRASTLRARSSPEVGPQMRLRLGFWSPGPHPSSEWRLPPVLGGAIKSSGWRLPPVLGGTMVPKSPALAFVLMAMRHSFNSVDIQCSFFPQNKRMRRSGSFASCFAWDCSTRTAAAKSSGKSQPTRAYSSPKNNWPYFMIALDGTCKVWLTPNQNGWKRPSISTPAPEA